MIKVWLVLVVHINGKEPVDSNQWFWNFNKKKTCTADSPNSFNKSGGKENQAPGVTSDSDQSDGESIEEEATFDQNGNRTMDIKRMRRLVE